MGGTKQRCIVDKTYADTLKNDEFVNLKEVFLSSGGRCIDAIKQNPNGLVGTYFAPQRKNLFCWYPFPKKSRILVIGDECLAATGILATFGHHITAVLGSESSADIAAKRFGECRTLKIVCGDVKTVTETTNKKFEYVILMPDFANLDGLSMIKSHLAPSSKILIVAENRSAMRFLAGECDADGRCFEKALGIESDSRRFSEKEWKVMLSEFSEKPFKFYYPYPDYTYTDEVYTKNHLPAPGIAKTYPPVFCGDRIRTINEDKLLSQIIKSGRFTEFSNAFFIEIGDDLSNIDYAKISCEREESLKTVTLISNCDGKTVTKHAASAMAERHIKKLQKNYEKLLSAYNGTGIRICPCEIADTEAKFPYVEGVTLAELISFAAQSGDMKSLISHIETLKNTVSVMSSGRSFAKSFRFSAFFGNLNIPAHLTSTFVSNIDMIAENIIINKHLNIIDYEWILDFPVPIEFIMFRSIFHNLSISRLSVEQKAAVYEAAGCRQEDIPLFVKMEEIFQKKISAGVFKYSDVAATINPIVCDINDVDPCSVYYASSIKTATGDVLCRLNAAIQDITLFSDLKGVSSQKIHIFPCDSDCILKVKNIELSKGTKRVVADQNNNNADYFDGEYYYFTSPPEFVIDCDDFDSVSASFYIAKRKDAFIKKIAELTAENIRLKNDIGKSAENDTEVNQ